ncbi:hypothetical protein HOLleu_07839 [Holothuria leucospilota]|uniref:Uncharacterized protein n=1 Tax=Holothuria leucospilota TaxID=206669 RepID=A0A9Q1HD18_HOLLE|nr:hypothetical protein HOLleu_07839 [Holothuria leucospilota]
MKRVETCDHSQQQASDDTVASMKQSQLERLQSEYETAIKNISELLKRDEEWFEGYEKTQNISKDADNKSVHSLTSKRSSNCSTSSQRLKEARVKHELAKLKMKQMKEKLELEQKQRQFAEDLLLLDPKNEFKRSELETSFWANEVEMEVDLLDEVHVSNVRPKVKVEDAGPSHADRGKEVQSGKVENKIEVNTQKPLRISQVWKVTVRWGESLEGKRAHKMLGNSIKLVNGRYEVGRPWRYPKPYLPDNRIVAEKRLTQSKKRFQRDNNLFQLYRDVMHDYISKGYGRKVTEESENKM